MATACIYNPKRCWRCCKICTSWRSTKTLPPLSKCLRVGCSRDVQDVWVNEGQDWTSLERWTELLPEGQTVRRFISDLRRYITGPAQSSSSGEQSQRNEQKNQSHDHVIYLNSVGRLGTSLICRRSCCLTVSMEHVLSLQMSWWYQVAAFSVLPPRLSKWARQLRPSSAERKTLTRCSVWLGSSNH